MFCGARQKIASRTPSSGITHPHPDDADPRARDRVDLGKAPVREAGDDRRHELRDAERNHQRVRRPLHEEEAVRPRHEDERL